VNGIFFQAGSIDIMNGKELKAFLDEWKQIVVILEAHTHDEDLHLHDVYMEVAPETANFLKEEHKELEQKIFHITQIASQLEQSETSSADRSRIWYQLG
jgi:hypothetical protein